MGKNLTEKDLRGRRATRSLLAVSLAASLAAFGCTTNQNLGNGTPVRSGGELRGAPTSGVTSGQERSTPPTMTSSWTSASVLPAVTPRTLSRADRAAAIMANRQSTTRGRYLGVVNPGPGGRPYASDRNALIASVPPNPALQTNPQLTINSSLTSGPTVAINSGAEGFVGGGDVLVSGATTTTGATSAAVVVNDVALGSPAVGATLPAGAFAATSLTPTAAISGLPTVTAASVGAGRTGGVAPLSTNAVGTTATTAPTTTTATTANVTTNTTSAGVRIVRPSTGSPVITNTTTSTRNQ